MDCPQCKGYALEPTELETGLLAASCTKCNGSLLPLMNYRYWVDQQTLGEGAATGQQTGDVVAEDSTQAKLCPKCSRLMTRYRIGVESDNRIELCSSCDEAWLDSGEWRLLGALDLHDKLPKIFTEAWQRNIREQRQTLDAQRHYADVLGDEAFGRLDEFARWIQDHPHRSEMLQYLQTNGSRSS